LLLCLTLGTRNFWKTKKVVPTDSLLTL